MVMEYLARGDLLGLLRKSRGIHDKYHRGEGSIEELGIYDLVSFAKQIATGMVFLGSRGVRVHRLHVRTFAPIATAHCYCSCKNTRYVMHRERALRNKINNIEKMTIATALRGFNDLGQSVTPTFLSRNAF